MRLPFCAIYIICMAFPISGVGGELTFCQIKYGMDASLTFEPVEANSGVTIEDSIFGNAKIKRDKKAPVPVGFRCILRDFKGSPKKCPAGMKYDTKRRESPSCLSISFPLKDLCPSEIDTNWSELRGKICDANIRK